MKHRTAIVCTVLATSTLLATQGFCDTSAAEMEMNAVSDKIQNFLFGPTVRKAALLLGFGAGLIQAFATGSIRPLLIYGGLGLIVNYLPKIVNWISAL